MGGELERSARSPAAPTVAALMWIRCRILAEIATNHAPALFKKTALNRISVCYFGDPPWHLSLSLSASSHKHIKQRRQNEISAGDALASKALVSAHMYMCLL